MHRFFRTLTIWIVALALPLQGYAAAAMISCGPMHAEMASDHHSGAHDHHSMDADSNHHDEKSSSLAQFLKFKCSACASCCTASAAPSSAVPGLCVMQAHPEAIPFFGSFEHSIVPDGLERPPRTSLI
jgi:hypothetical protein